MANEEHAHVALPKLYGAPAYARPPMLRIVTAERPFDPDSLPLESERTDDERDLVVELSGQSWTGAGHGDLPPSREGSPLLRGRPFQLGAFTRRIRRNGTTDGR